MQAFEQTRSINEGKVKYEVGSFFTSNREYRERYMTCCKKYLYIFKHGPANETQREKIQICQIEGVQRMQSNENGFCVILKDKSGTNREKKFIAPSQKDVNEWVNVIENLAFSHSKSFYIEKKYFVNSKPRSAIEGGNQRKSQMMEEQTQFENGVRYESFQYDSKIIEGDQRDPSEVENERLKKQLNERKQLFKDEKQILEKRIAMMDEDIKNERNILEEKKMILDKHIEEIGKLESKVENLQETLSEKELRIIEKGDQYERLHQKFRAQQRTVDQKYQHLHQVRQNEQILYQKLRQLHEKLDQKSSELSQSKSSEYEFKKKYSESTQKLEEKEKEIDALKKILEEKDKTIEQLKKREFQKDEENKKLKWELESIMAPVNNQSNGSMMLMDRNISQIVNSYEKVNALYQKKVRIIQDIEVILEEKSKDKSMEISIEELASISSHSDTSHLSQQVSLISNFYSSLMEIFQLLRNKLLQLRLKEKEELKLIEEIGSLSQISNHSLSQNGSNLSILKMIPERDQIPEKDQE